MRRGASTAAALMTVAFGVLDAGRAVAQTKNPFDGNAPAISNGAAMFRNRCAGCHGPDAHGYLGPDLTGFWANGGSDEKMFGIVAGKMTRRRMTDRLAPQFCAFQISRVWTPRKPK